ncbi:hypothetical protein LPJ59_000272 [Coemansia sp. RSA 2399]|nr:hypothetical protein LPJ59_000272 [Coemansia sp. RSA 2399]KAJ1907635.1 hypothetical protein LPJ81_000624 [Coemansia sp. IMI 209127]
MSSNQTSPTSPPPPVPSPPGRGTRTLHKSPSRTLRSRQEPMEESITEHTALMDQTLSAMSLSASGLLLDSGGALGDDEALSMMTSAAAAAAKAGVRNTAAKRGSRGGTSDFASRPHTNASASVPPLPATIAALPQFGGGGGGGLVSRGTSVSEGSKDIGKMVEPRAPTPAMYWSQTRTWGSRPPKMRSQSLNVVGNNIYVFGGWNNSVCYNDVYVLDTETMFWSRMAAAGDAVPPCRAHTATAVGHRLFVFGGGDGTRYFSDLYVLDTRSCVWARARIAGTGPSARRTHTCFYYGGYVYLFGGGDGHRALNDLWRVRAEPNADGAYEWEEVDTRGGRPFPRGYHTSTLVGNQLVVFGGSDGQECFGDTSLLSLDTMEWSHVTIDPPLTRLAHSATLVGMYLFVICGHDGADYANQVLMLKLDTLRWETRAIYGPPPVPRGYHACALHDGRLYVHGGYNGQEVFDDLYTLELSSYSYLPQVPEFVIGCHR